ncbi:hypothetical protein ACGF13_30220 [Kitasatospora sp. NPDC048286]|uniref:hypothetical protein n=1 Tax=Kitasatospora sp. NPDC048286 TaxID=3364047 RepID=UPI00370F796B
MPSTFTVFFEGPFWVGVLEIAGPRGAGHLNRAAAKRRAAEAALDRRAAARRQAKERHRGR